MAVGDETIKSFLVGLGFDIDEAGLSKFNKSIKAAALQVTALYASVKIASAGIAYGIAQISESFEEIGYEYRIVAPAFNKVLLMRQEFLKAYSAAGVNLQKVVQDSIRLNFSLTKTKYAVEALYRSVGAKFFGLLTKQSDLFRKKIYENMPAIQNILEAFVRFIFKALEIVTQLGARIWEVLGGIYDFFKKLHDATDGWSTVILAVIAAWRLLNLEFLATPLGALIAGIITLIALYDDFKVWKEGGKSFFDWSSFVPVINAVMFALEALKKVWEDIIDIVGNVFLAFWKLFHLDFSGFFSSLGDALISVIHLINDWFSSFKAQIDALLSGVKFVTDWALHFIGQGENPNVSANVQNNPVIGPQTNPLGGNTQNNSQVNQNVHQQTNISVQGSADAQSVGKSVANEQGRVNFDMTRNFQSAVVK